MNSTIRAAKSLMKRRQECMVHHIAGSSCTVRAAVMAVRCINNH